MAKDIEGCQELWHYKQPALATTKDHGQLEISAHATLETIKRKRKQRKCKAY